GTLRSTRRNCPHGRLARGTDAVPHSRPPIRRPLVMSSPHITAVEPAAAIPGGRVSLIGRGFPTDAAQLPEILIQERRARIVFASPQRLSVVVPADIAEGGRLGVRIAGQSCDVAFVYVAAPVATGLHQVASPVADQAVNVYVAYSGPRGQQVPVTIFRVAPNGTRETYSSAVVNPTSMAFDPEGRLYVSSRFEGTVYRLSPDG